MAGRKTKLTPDRQTTIVRLVRAGNYLQTAAAAAGINSDTLNEWLKRGAREEEGIYAEFTAAVNEAAGAAEARAVAIIAKAAETQWQAAAWFLERSHRNRWGRQAALAPAEETAKTEPEKPFWEEH